MYTVTPTEMKKAEERSEKNGISCAGLMDNVGKEIAFKTDKLFSAKGKSVTILCGTGNNGGDGFALAKELSALGAFTTVICTAYPKTDLAKTCFERNRPCFSKLFICDKDNKEDILSEISNADIITDCIFGTGFHGEIEDKIISLLIEKANKADAIRLSADIPSGADADTGKVSEICFNADYTFALGAVKTGHLKNPATEKCGNIIPLDIGIADYCYQDTEAVICDDRVFDFLPERKRLSNKGSYGKLLNVSGSSRCHGAAWLSTNAAIKTGTGLVRLASVKSVTESVASTLHECVFEPCGDSDNIKAEYKKAISQLAQSSTAVICGCGMGNNSDTAEIITDIINSTNCPVVIDADGISAISPHIDELKDNNRLLFTPHPAEFSRLCGLSVEEILSDRISAAKEFSVKYGVNVLLKDAYSVFAASDGFTAVILSGNAGLAKAGSGDTLAGTIGGFSAQGLDIKKAVMLGAYLFGLSAEYLAKDDDLSAVLPSRLPDVYGKIIKEQRR